MRLLLLLCGLVATAAVARADDWSVTRSPFDPRLVDRYKAMLRHDPDDAFAWKRLTSLYKSYRSLGELERELEARAGKSHEFADLELYGHLARERGDHAAAATRYRAALAAKPDDPRGAVALADELHATKQDAEAKQLYEGAVAKLDPKLRRAVYRKLADIALDGSDVDAAKRAFEKLIALDPNDVDVRRELAEALAAKKRAPEALAAYREIAPRLASRPEKAAEAWRRIGELSEEAGDDVAALEAYRKGFAMLPRTNYLRRDLIDKIIALYGKKDDLRSLITIEEKTPPSARGFAEWETLARLYDQVGDAVGAIAAYKKALAADRHALDARKRLIAILERAGRDAEAIEEYQRLCAEAPGDSRYQLELAERYARGGAAGRKKAVDLLNRLSSRFPRDPSVHGALAELYTRWGDSERAQREHETLARLEPDDETHLVDLGEIYWQRGKRKQALDTWQKLESHAKDRATGMARLAEVLGDHEMAGNAVELYEKALKLSPKDLALKRGLANALERVHRVGEAEQRWVEIYDQARDPKARSLRLEARARLIALAHKEGRLSPKLRDYVRLWEGPPPDDDWGLVVADAYLKLGRTESAAETLGTIARRATTVDGKVEAEIGLAQVYKSKRKLKEAIAALERAAELAPSRAKELYSQIAELSLSLYRDEEALAYANKAVALAPGDAQAEVRLAEIHERQEDDAGAIDAYKKALALDPRLYKVDFALARLYLRRGQPTEAARLYRDVVQHAPEEELVLDAARRAIDLEEYLGTLGDLQRTLTPLAYLHGSKPVYRRLLIELYDRYGTPLAALARRGDAEAQKELHRLGEHGLKPLTEALVDGEPSEQRVAAGLLGELGNPSAAPSLLRLATRTADASLGLQAPDVDLRVEAAFAAARLADPGSFAELQKLTGEREKQLRIAGLDGLGRMKDKRATALLAKGLSDGSSDVQAMSCIGLARSGADAHALASLRALASDASRPDYVRAAAAIALGANGDAASVEALSAMLRQGSDDPQRAAAWALGAIGDRRAEPVLLRAVFVQRDEVRRVAVEALDHLANNGPAARASFEGRRDGTLGPATEWGPILDVAALVRRMARPTGARAANLPFAGESGQFATAAAAALDDALSRHRDLQLRALADLDGRTRGITLGPLAPREPASDADRRAWDRVLDEIAAKIEPTLVVLTRTGDPLVSSRAVALLGHLPTPGAAAARLAALDEKSIGVRLAALSALAVSDEAPRAAQLLSASDWRERCAAADATGRLAPAASLAALGHLLDDPNGFVREHAARALGHAGAPAVPLLAAHLRDEAPDVRRAIADSLVASASPAAAGPLSVLARDPDPSVREAATRSRDRQPSP
jgi:tetratricopeptide (TPR) repeat protein/HEAT repeat protein